MKIKKASIFLLSFLVFTLMISNVYANNIGLRWVESYYSDKYPTSEGYDIASYSYYEEKQVVFVEVSKRDLEENTYILATGLYDETNLTVSDLMWVNTYFSMKYPSSQGYVIYDTYSYDSKTNIVTVEVGIKGTSKLIKDYVKYDVFVNGRAFIKLSK